MKLLPSTNKQAVILLIILSIFTMLIALIFTAPPEIASLATTQEDSWRLPAPNKTDNTQALYAKMRKLMPWGVDATGKDDATTNKKTTSLRNWRLVGVVREGEKRYVLLLDDKKKVNRYSYKMRLPDDTYLLAIHDNFIEIARDNESEIIKLYQRDLPPVKK